VPLLWLAQQVLCLPAGEADAEGALGGLRTLGDYASQMAADTILRRVHMALSQTNQGAHG
jgi:hypothetical protein